MCNFSHLTVDLRTYSTGSPGACLTGLSGAYVLEHLLHAPHLVPKDLKDGNCKDNDHKTLAFSSLTFHGLRFNMLFFML